MNTGFWNTTVADPPEGSLYGGFRLGEKISSTRSSIVYHTVDPKTGAPMAIKFVKIRSGKRHHADSERELSVSCHHPNIVKATTAFESGCFLCIVLPLAEGSLLDYVHAFYKDGMPESVARPIVKQMLSALKYLRDKSIVHRDIKLENFLVFGVDNDVPVVKLCDFGFATYMPTNRLEFLGTPRYYAPEVLRNLRYSFEVDMFSLGVCVFFMLTHRFPFPFCAKEEGLDAYKRRVLRGRYDAADIESKAAGDFVARLLATNPKDRLTPDEAMRHAWIDDEEAELMDIANTVTSYEPESIELHLNGADLFI